MLAHKSITSTADIMGLVAPLMILASSFNMDGKTKKNNVLSMLKLEIAEKVSSNASKSIIADIDNLITRMIDEMYLLNISKFTKLIRCC